MKRSARAAAIAVAAGALAPAFFARSALGMDDQVFTFFQAERLEYRLADGHDSVNWEAQGWAGQDYQKLWLKTEGERVVDGDLEEAEVQLLYSRLISDFFDVQAGVRYDLEPRPRRGFAVLGVQGLAPYFFEIDAATFVSHEGEVSARFEAEYEILLTQRLILQPTVETNIAVQSVRARGVGSGFNDVELGLRLRYEIRREFAPYIGVSWERKLGETADFARDEDEEVESLSFVAGVRFWF